MAADAPGPASSFDDEPALTDSQRALRAQLLATEHWSLLASRSTTQSEVLTRIAIFLTMVSAGLVSLGVLGNATGFRGWFGLAAIGVLLLLVLLGVITLVRAFNTATEDMMYVLAMNRLRGAYLDLDPGLAPYLLMAADDDEAGVGRTYHFLWERNASVVFGSSMMVITVVTGVVTGLFTGGVVALAGGAGWLVVAVGAATTVGVVAVAMRHGYRMYRRTFRTHVPLRPRPSP